MTNTNNTMIAPEYTITCAAARNSAPSDQYSTASDIITTTSDSALLMGCFCRSRFSAPCNRKHREDDEQGKLHEGPSSLSCVLKGRALCRLSRRL